MKTRDDDVFTVDPEDAAAAAAWAVKRGAAAGSLAAARAELARLTAAVAAPPGPAVLAAAAAARTTAAAAQSAATDASGRVTTAATTTAHYEATTVTAAQVALDDATRVLSQTLAELLRTANTTSAITATVDGLALRARYLAGTATTPPGWDHTTLPFPAQSGDSPIDPQLVLPAVGETDYLSLLAVLDDLDAGVDAVADLVTAESVHQLVQGNLVRSGAALDVATSGAVPDGFDVIATAQTGEAVTHRVLVLIDAAAMARWPVASKPGSLADPLLSAWLTTVLPAPSAIGVTAARRDPVTGDVTDPYSFTLDTLGLDPLGLVRVAADSGELRQRLALAARRHWATSLGGVDAAEVAATGDLVIGAGNAGFGLDDLIGAAELVRALIGRARALGGDDLTGPTAASPGPSASLADALTTRVAAVSSAAESTVAGLTAALGSTDRWVTADALLAASDWGVPGAAPQLDQGVPALGVLQAQVARVNAELTRRLAGNAFEPAAGDAAVTIRRARARLQQLVGWQIPVLVDVTKPDAATWQPLTGAAVLAGAQPATLREWLDSYARVRPAVAALLDAYDVAEALGTGGTLSVAATQIVAGTPDGAWHGADPEPPPGLTSIVVQRAFAGTPATVTGLAVDSWTQRTPGRQAQAAVAFHFDEPDSTPPQVALVAVAPDLSAAHRPGTWDLETLCDTLLATLALARQRATAAENTAAHGITVKEAL